MSSSPLQYRNRMKRLKLFTQLLTATAAAAAKRPLAATRIYSLRNYSSVIQERVKQADQGLKERIEQIPQDRYRNFSIVAHVDHGKSTLSDGLLIETNTIPSNSNRQFLDKLDVERERGITVKAQTCTMIYKDTRDGLDYLLHLIDTPGHVDFRAEVSRSYASCEGALLLIDASQGVQAQTVANFYLAHSLGLKLIPVINKIDLDHANVPRCLDQIESMFQLDPKDAILVSAKNKVNIHQVLPAVVDRIEPPKGQSSSPLKCLLVDSWFDTYLGVILLVNVKEGVVTSSSKIQSAHTKIKYQVKEVGIMYPDRTRVDSLKAGQVGYIVLGMKDSNEAYIGDTFFQVGQPVEPLPGFEEPKPMVFIGAFPTESGDLKRLEESINHLIVNDKSVHIQKETSVALGQGWRLGFLGTLHASVFQERLLNEHGKQLIVTSPTVPFKVVYRDGKEKIISNPDEFPSIQDRRISVTRVEEPVVDAIMTVPDEYLGQVIQLCENNRGQQLDISYITSSSQVVVKYQLPIAQLIEDFFGKLKACTRGYASLDYQESGYIPSDVKKLELLVNGQPVDALSRVLHASQIQATAKDWVERFKKYVGNQLFEVAIQAVADNKIIARQTVKAKRKDVLAKLHASDISRRRKLLENQKQGKKNLKAAGRVHIPLDSFKSFLSKDDGGV